MFRDNRQSISESGLDEQKLEHLESMKVVVIVK